MSERTHLFHTILPTPECESGHPRQQMRLGGNTSLHAIEYQCSLCLRRLRVIATFSETQLNPGIDPAVKAEVDSQE